MMQPGEFAFFLLGLCLLIAVGGLVRLSQAVRQHQKAEKTLQAREQYLSLLSEITRAALEASDLLTMLQTLADRMGPLFKADGCYITLWDEENQRTIPTAAYGPMRSTYPRPHSDPAERTMTQSVLEAGHVLVAEDVFHTPHLSSKIAARYPARSMMGLPLIAGGQKLGAALITFNVPRTFSPEEIIMAEQAAAQIALAVQKMQLLREKEAANLQLQQILQQVNILASTDPLTGAYNRYKFEDLIKHELYRAFRYDEPISLIMFDIDHFKEVNDTYGHHVGDQVMVELIHLVHTNVRSSDSITRWGGDEFIVLAACTDKEQACLLAEKIRAIIANHMFHTAGTVTISLGVTQNQPGDSLHEMIIRADHALYHAKQQGRNRVAEPPVINEGQNWKTFMGFQASSKIQ